MGNEQNDMERMSKFETKLEFIGDMLSKLDEKIEKLYSHFTTKDILQIELRLRDEKIEGLQKAVSEIRTEKQTNKQIFPNWIQAIFAIAAFGVSIVAILYK